MTWGKSRKMRSRRRMASGDSIDWAKGLQHRTHQGGRSKVQGFLRKWLNGFFTILGGFLYLGAIPRLAWLLN